jgi:hypothetical protein
MQRAEARVWGSVACSGLPGDRVVPVVVVEAVISMSKSFWQSTEYLMSALQLLVTSGVLLSMLSRPKPRSSEAEVFSRPWSSLPWGQQSCREQLKECPSAVFKCVTHRF